MACFLCNVLVVADIVLLDRDWVPAGFRFELSRLMTGVGLAAIPVAVFGSDWPVGAVSGCVAGIGLLVLSLTVHRKHIRPVFVVLTCQALGMFLSLIFWPMIGGFSTHGEVGFFSALFFGASIGGLWGFFVNASERRDARARIEARATRVGELEEDTDIQLK